MAQVHTSSSTRASLPHLSSRPNPHRRHPTSGQPHNLGRINRPHTSTRTGHPHRRSTPSRIGPTQRRDHYPHRAQNARQAKIRAKVRQSTAPKVLPIPIRDRITHHLSHLDLRPYQLIKKVPFVVFVIAALGIGLALTLWLSADAASHSYELSALRDHNRVLLEEKEALERDVLIGQSAPALAQAASQLGMIPSRNTAHLIQDPQGNWIVIGHPKPAEGEGLPPLNTQITPEPTPMEVPTPLQGLNHQDNQPLGSLTPPGPPPQPVSGANPLIPFAQNPEVIRRVPTPASSWPTPVAPLGGPQGAIPPDSQNIPPSAAPFIPAHSPLSSFPAAIQPPASHPLGSERPTFVPPAQSPSLGNQPAIIPTPINPLLSPPIPGFGQHESGILPGGITGTQPPMGQ